MEENYAYQLKAAVASLLNVSASSSTSTSNHQENDPYMPQLDFTPLYPNTTVSRQSFMDLSTDTVEIVIEATELEEEGDEISVDEIEIEIHDGEQQIPDIPPTQKGAENHHRGKIPIQYVTDKRKRTVAYAKRVKTLKMLARELHILTGAETYFSSKSESGRVKRYSSNPDNVKKRRTVGVQAGNTFVNKLACTRSTEQALLTPTKKARKSVSTSTSLKIKNLPGKK